uniref:Uncharacterized protein n=1 Tax=Parascaris equorum TaxID=6256 RepID=A0A914R4Z0_PAREQ
MQRLSAKNKELKVVEAEINSLENWIKEMEKKVELRRREEAVKAANNKLDRAQAMQQDRVGRFGGNMRRILRLLEDNSRLFTRKPVGPVGKTTL